MFLQAREMHECTRPTDFFGYYSSEKSKNQVSFLQKLNLTFDHFLTFLLKKTLNA